MTLQADLINALAVAMDVIHTGRQRTGEITERMLTVVHTCTWQQVPNELAHRRNPVKTKTILLILVS